MKEKRATTLGRIVLLSVFIFCIILFSGCKKSAEESNSSESVSATKDYFPQKVQVKYSSKFDIKYFNNYKVVYILNPYNDTNDTLTYVLVQRGTPKPKEYKNAQVIEIPIKTFACVYTTQAAFVDLLDATDIIKGFASPEYIINPIIKERIKEGKIAYIGQPSDLNIEAILALNPELLMVASLGASDFPKYQPLRESGIGVMVNSEWTENTPLGRAEWAKLMAVFLNKEKLANEKFDQIEKEYLKLVALTKNVKDKPNILTGLSYKDAWYIPGGRSFVANYLKDAGATYPWVSDTTTASFPLDFESVYAKGMDVDIWVNMEGARSKKEMLEADPRYGDFKAFKTDRVFNHNKRLSENGGNEFWEKGVTTPHIILADLIKIFHPELLPNHQLYYYHQLK